MTATCQLASDDVTSKLPNQTFTWNTKIKLFRTTIFNHETEIMVDRAYHRPVHDTNSTSVFCGEARER